MAHDVNTALERLEKNLKDLNSATKQVRDTVDASNELRKTADDYVKSITNLYSQVQEWEEQLKNTQTASSAGFLEAFDTFKEYCRKIAADFMMSIIETLDKFADQHTHLTQCVDGLNAEREQLKTTMETIVEAINNRLNELTATALEEACDKIATDFRSSAGETIGEFAKQNTLLTAHVESLNAEREGLKASMDSAVAAISKKLNMFSDVLSESQKSQDDVLSDIIKGVSEFPATLKETTDNAVQQMDEKQKLLHQELVSVSSDIKEVMLRIDTLSDSCCKLQKSVNINRWIIVVGFVIIVALYFGFTYGEKLKWLTNLF